MYSYTAADHGERVTAAVVVANEIFTSFRAIKNRIRTDGIFFTIFQ